MSTVIHSAVPEIFHVSEDSSIQEFVPRPTPESHPNLAGKPLVWAVDREHLCNYLLPRDCPRVTYRLNKNSKKEELSELFSPNSTKVIALESGWFERVQSTALYVYSLPPETFSLTDPIAGYYTSEEVVKPQSMVTVLNPLSQLFDQSVEVRFLENLWELSDQVTATAVDFSIIRMRFAQPRQKT